MTCLDEHQLREIMSRGLACVPGATEHLADCHSCGVRLKELCTAATENEHPERLGRYVIVRPYGQGRFGKVYEAHDPDLDRVVALKVIATSDHLRSVEAIAREAQAMARVKDPHVVQIHDAQIMDGDVILTMEAIDGVSLDQWIEQGPPSRRQVLRVCHQAALGLAATHAAGIIHRDVKPPNILVDANSRAYLADFGLATTLGVIEPATSSHVLKLDLTVSTRTAAFAGTPAYMAPELFAGEAASPRSDVYALAIVIHEALLGSRPFESCSTVLELREAQRGGVPVRQLTRAGLPKRIARALSRALHPDPGARADTAADLARAVSPKTTRMRNIVIAAAVAMVLLSVAGITVGRIWTGHEALDDQRERHASCIADVADIASFADQAALDRLDRSIHQGSSAGHVWSAARHRLEKLGQQIEVHGRGSCTATCVEGVQSQMAHDQTVACFESVAADAGELVHQLERDRGADSYPILLDVSSWSILPCLDGTFATRHAGATGEQLYTIRRMERVLGQLAYALQREDTATVNSLRTRFASLAADLDPARALEYQFKFDSRILAAKQQWDRVEEVCQTQLSGGVDETSHTAAEAWVRLIEALVKQGRYDEANVAMTAAARDIERAANEPTVRSRYLYYKARLDYLQGNFDAARVILNELVDLREQLDDELALAHALKTLGAVELNLGEVKVAGAHLDRASRLTSVWQGPLSKAALEIRASMAELALENGELERAAQLTGEVIAAAEEIPALKDWFFVNEHVRLARIEIAGGALDRAETALRAAQKAAAARTQPTDQLQIDATWVSLLSHRGMYEAAWERCDQLHLSENAVRSEDALIVLPALASCAQNASESDPARGMGFYRLGLEISSRARTSRWTSWFQIALGLLQAQGHSFGDASQHLQAGLDGDQQRVPVHLRAQALYALAACRANLDQHELARDLSTQASDLSGDSTRCNHPTCKAVLTGAKDLLAELSRVR